jgi:hypothetical protein
VIYVTSDPAGACAASAQLRFNTSNGKLWGCNALTWGQIGGGGAPSGSANHFIYGDTTGALAAFTARTFYYAPVIVSDDSVGLDDLTVGGTYTGPLSSNTLYDVRIDSTGTPDTFAWEGPTGSASNVPITGSAQLLEYGISVRFGATTGHTVTSYRAWFIAPWKDEGSGYRFFSGGFAFIYDLHAAAAFAQEFAEVSSSPYHLSVTDGSAVMCDATSVNVTLLLPRASFFYNAWYASPVFTIKKIDSSTHTCTVQPNGSDKIDGLNSVVLTAQNQYVAVASIPSGGWGVVGQTTTPSVGYCTAATLATVLINNGDQCMCTDCQPTSGSDDTCTGSGGYWLAYKTGSANVCR